MVNGAPVFNYAYNIKDHLGNIRVTFGFDPTGQIEKILEENHYYPFGLKHTNYNDNISDFIKKQEGPGISIEELAFGQIGAYRYKYQSQEWQDELGLGWYSFKWRNYDPAIARFMSIDPLTESYEDYTPYQFASNQPVHAQEIEGLESSHDLNKRIQTRETRTVVNDAIPKPRQTNPLRTQAPKDSESKSKQGGYAISDGGNNQDPSSLRRGGRDVQWIDLGGALEYILSAFLVEKKGSTPNGKGTNGGKPTSADNVDSAVDAVDAATGATKEAVEASEEKTSYQTQTTYSSGQVHTSGVREGTKKEIQQDSTKLTKSKDGTGGKQTETRIIRQ